MDTSTESLLMLASGASRRCGDGEGPLLAGAAQAVPVALLPTASPPPQLPARRLPLPATASLRCGLPAPDHRCQGRAGGGREWGGPARLGLDNGGRLGLPAREGAPSQVGGQSVYIKSEVAFGFCHLLGFQLMPRLKNIHAQKLYRPQAGTPDAYPNLQLILTRPINWDLIRQQYDQMIKFATALRLGTAETEAILRRFTLNNVQHPTYQAFAELGKVIKTIFLCNYLQSEALRREIHEGLKTIENWNSANGFIFFGHEGAFATNNVEAQEIAALCLHLLQMSLVYILSRDFSGIGKKAIIHTGAASPAISSMVGASVQRHFICAMQSLEKMACGASRGSPKSRDNS